MLELLIESSSSGEHYAVTFTREGTNLRTSCTCPAGQKGIHCKHRLSLLAGDLSSIVGEVPADIGAQLAALLPPAWQAYAAAGIVVARAIRQSRDACGG